jgi:hypothetical protein
VASKTRVSVVMGGLEGGIGMETLRTWFSRDWRDCFVAGFIM